MVPGILKKITTLVLNLLLLLLMPHLSSALEIEAITKPSADVSLSFVRHGKVHEVMVRKGGHVAAGDLLARLEGEVELVQYELLKARANDTTIIKIAQTELLQKEKDLEKMKEAQENGAVTDWEVDHAGLEAETARLELKLAEFEQVQNQLKQKEFKTALSNLEIRSPIKGIVEEVKIEKGESVQALAPVIRIVDTEDLLIDIAVPVSKAKTLAINMEVAIQFPGDSRVQGRIDNIASVADSAANTLSISVITKNPGDRPAGERVTVFFPEAEGSVQGEKSL